MQKQRKKVGLALGSGGIRGLAHIGVIKKLLEHNIPIDFIAGSSIGAWVGAHYALFQDIKKLEEYTVERKKEKFLSFLEPTINGGLVKGFKVEKLLAEWLNNAKFSDTKIPLKIVATDLVSGEAVIFEDGSLSTAVRASMSIPTLFTPVKLGDTLLVDGSMSDPVPDDIVKKMGADIVISVNLDNYIKNEKFLGDETNFGSIAQRSLNILRYNLSLCSTTSSDIIIEPYTPVVGIRSFKDYFSENIVVNLVKNGADETEKNIKKIKALL